MPGRQYSAGSGYRYGFNGKENDNDVKGLANQQDYGMRIYDPRLARFLSIDPLTRNYPDYTPFSFAGNKPLKYIDLDGEEEKKHWYDYSFPELMTFLGESDNSFENINKGKGPIGRSLETFNREVNPVGIIAYDGYQLTTGTDLSTGAPKPRFAAVEHFTLNAILYATGEKLFGSVGRNMIKFETKLETEELISAAKPKVEQPALQLNKSEIEEIKTFVKSESSQGKNITVPKNWIQKQSKVDGGVRYIDPNNSRNSIRVMPGNSKSPFPSQQVPFIKYQKNGVLYDVNGLPVKGGNEASAHIPQSQFNQSKMPKFEKE